MKVAVSQVVLTFIEAGHNLKRVETNPDLLEFPARNIAFHATDLQQLTLAVKQEVNSSCMKLV